MKARELEKCIDEFGTEIYRFCMKLCADKANADDLYQQTFLKALESSMELDWEQNPKALFFSFAYNLWKSEQRKNARRSALVPCVSFDDADEVLLRSGENIEENIFRQELIRETKKIIAGLPEKIRTPLTLYYLFEQPVQFDFIFVTGRICPCDCFQSMHCLAGRGLLPVYGHRGYFDYAAGCQKSRFKGSRYHSYSEKRCFI